MSNPKALAAKEKGNAAFKAGDYPTAIGHYTTAIMADRNDATYPLNRAAAYLKLGKNEDAERDCTKTLELSPGNVKALFRRGLARMSLGSYAAAKQDLLDVLQLEPSNPDAKSQLHNLAETLQKEVSKAKDLKGKMAVRSQESQPKQKPSPQKPTIKVPEAKSQLKNGKTAESVQDTKNSPILPAKASVDEEYPHQRRRVPIDIVDANGNLVVLPSSQPQNMKVVDSPTVKSVVQTPPASDGFRPISSRSLKPDTSTHSAPKSTSSESLVSGPSVSTTTHPSEGSATIKPASFQDAKQARQNVRPSRVGGGVFRASGQNTIFPTRGGEPLAKPSDQQPVAEVVTSPSPNTTMSDAETSVLNHLRQKPPTTLFEFTKAWGSLSSIEAHWQLINIISPTTFPALCKTSLEPSLLSSILANFHHKLDQDSVNDGDDTTSTNVKKLVSEYMDNLSRIPRFETILLFLSKPEKELAKRVWERLGVLQPSGVWKCVA